jgi:GTP cyclohydrolase IA
VNKPVPGTDEMTEIVRLSFKPHVASDAVRQLLQAIGQDTSREGLRDTPDRVARFLLQFCTPEPFTFTTFDAEGMDELIVQAGIPFYSLCEHHMLPFFGTACVGYIPNGRIVGLSKLARCVQFNAAGLQNQERITNAVAMQLSQALEVRRLEPLPSHLDEADSVLDAREPRTIGVVDGPLGIGVLLRARHMCMEMRGVQAHDTWTTTSKLTGALLEKPEARAEFMALARNGAV